MYIDVTINPVDTTPDRVLHRNVVVIDVFRATSVMITALLHGARKIIPLSTIEEAFDMKDVLLSRGESALIAGERDALMVDGFDKDNSPASFMNDSIADKTIIMSTTNGTRAVNATRLSSKTYIAAFINYKAVCDRLLLENKDITFVCSGRQNRLTAEDSLCAGMMIDYLLHTPPSSVATLSDIARVTLQHYLYNKSNLQKALQETEHYKHLVQLGLQADIDYCLQTDITNLIAVMNKDSYAIVRY